METINQNITASSHSQNVVFKGIYALRGNVESIYAAKNMIIDGVKPNSFKYKFKTISEAKDILTIGVATGTDIKNISTDGFIKSALKRIIDAKEMINPFETIWFNAFKGKIVKVTEFYKDGKRFITTDYPDNNPISIIKFNEPKSLLDALSELAAIPATLKIEDKTFSYEKRNILDLLEYSDDLNECNDLRKLKIKGLCGMGGDSTVLELPNEYCLKLSLKPNAPLKDEIYDIPTILKRKKEVKYPLYDLEGSKKYIYYTIQKKGLNKNEYRILPEHLKQVKRTILQTDPSSKIIDFDNRQIALLDGKPYLIDAQVIDNRALYE